MYTCRKRAGGGKKTRPLDYIESTVKTLVRTSSNEENEESIAAPNKMVSSAPTIKKSPRDQEARALAQVQVPVA